MIHRYRSIEFYLLVTGYDLEKHNKIIKVPCNGQQQPYEMFLRVPNIHNYDNQYSDCYKFMTSLWGFFPVLLNSCDIFIDIERKLCSRQATRAL